MDKLVRRFGDLVRAAGVEVAERIDSASMRAYEVIYRASGFFSKCGCWDEEADCCERHGTPCPCECHKH